MINYYLNEVVRRIRKSKFDRRIKSILSTSAVELSDVGPIVLSMVHHRDVLPYLAALKSLSVFLSIKKVVIVADRSITKEDRDIFLKHIPAVSIREIGDFQRDGIPSGGCNF